jgi:hypothetical protein
MARITMLTPDQLDPEPRARSRADERTPLELGLTRLFGHQLAMAAGLGAFSAALKANRTLPERLIELVCLRVAFHNQYRSCMAIRYPDPLADGLTEDLVCSLERPMDADNLDERERLRSATAPTFKGVWYSSVNFAGSRGSHTTSDQPPAHHRPSRDAPAAHSPGTSPWYRPVTGPSSLG